MNRLIFILLAASFTLTAVVTVAEKAVGEGRARPAAGEAAGMTIDRAGASGPVGTTGRPATGRPDPRATH